MPITRRESIASVLALALPEYPGFLAADPKNAGLRLSTFITEITPPVGHPCMGGGIAPVKEIVDPLFHLGARQIPGEVAIDQGARNLHMDQIRRMKRISAVEQRLRRGGMIFRNEPLDDDACVNDELHDRSA